MGIEKLCLPFENRSLFLFEESFNESGSQDKERANCWLFNQKLIRLVSMTKSCMKKGFLSSDKWAFHNILQQSCAKVGSGVILELRHNTIYDEFSMHLTSSYKWLQKFSSRPDVNWKLAIIVIVSERAKLRSSFHSCKLTTDPSFMNFSFSTFSEHKTFLKPHLLIFKTCFYFFLWQLTQQWTPSFRITLIRKHQKCSIVW